jgi:hypothetical protein
MIGVGAGAARMRGGRVARAMTAALPIIMMVRTPTLGVALPIFAIAAVSRIEGHDLTCGAALTQSRRIEATDALRYRRHLLWLAGVLDDRQRRRCRMKGRGPSDVSVAR